MFSLPWLKRKAVPEERSSFAFVELEWLEPFLPIVSGIPRPDWNGIHNFVEANCKDQDMDELWCNIARNWAALIIEVSPSDYVSLETENFILICGPDEKYMDLLSRCLERSRKRLLNTAKGICLDEGAGKHLVIVTADLERYYDYVSFYGPQEGSYGLTSGMYINYGYGHFVFTQESLDAAEPIIAHELTHALLAHLPIPLWLNEGMAVNMESMVAGCPPELMNGSLFNLHAGYWDESTIQEFWSGESFFRPDEGQKLSYQLAQILVTSLSTNYQAFSCFANKADWVDAGESAIKEVYGLSLSDLIVRFLGEGDWCSKPGTWPSDK